MASERDRLKAKAANLIHAAIKCGDLLKPTNYLCVDCGKPAKQYDHRDYRKPLDVVPVCISCNIKRGPGLPKIREEDERQYKLDQPAGYKWSGMDGGEGYSPTESVCHIGVDELFTNDVLQFDWKSDPNISEMENNYQGAVAKSNMWIREETARYIWAKLHDPWCPN